MFNSETNSAFPPLSQDVHKSVLDNGLTVLLKVVPTAPVVTVQVWYQVGSAHEPSGWNGISHQLEHLMFKGTQSRPIQFGRLFSALGSDSNAFTSYEQTAYFSTAEADKLLTLLTLEADRMTQVQIEAESLALEKGVVISELDGYDNDPSYRLDRTVMKALFPNHPYGLPVGGTRTEVAEFTVKQVRQYYQTYYRPENAVLVVVGDFDFNMIQAAIAATFGQVPAGSSHPDYQPQAIPMIREARSRSQVKLTDTGSMPLLQVVYPIPAIAHPDLPALQVLDLILTEGRNSRLEQSLVDQGWASQVSSYPASFQQGGWYSFWVTPAPDQQLADVHRELQKSLQSLIENGVTEEELRRAKRQLLAAVVLGNRDISSQAMQLGQDHCLTGDYQFSDRYLSQVNDLVPASIQRVAELYLRDEVVVVGEFEPTAFSEDMGGGFGQMTHTQEQFGTGEPVNPAEVAQYFPNGEHSVSVPMTLKPPIEIRLHNGVRVLLLEDRSTPTVTLSGYLRAGSEFDTEELAGLASLTADNLLSGTKDKDALMLARLLEDQGADLDVNANREGVLINGTALCTDLKLLLSLLGDILQNSTFPEDELAISRQQAIAAVRMQQDDPSRLGRIKIQQTLYPQDHPFYAFPTEASLGQVQRQHLLEFYQTYYRPEESVFMLIGHFQTNDVTAWLEESLGHWSRDSVAPQPKPVPPFVSQGSSHLTQTLPGKTQTVTFLGHSGIDRRDSRIYAAMLLNQVLGGDTLASRLGTEIRDRQGLTYGIYSYFQAGRYPGPFLIEMQTAPEDTKAAIASTLKLLQQMHDQGVTPEELSAAQRTLSSSFAVDLAHPEQLSISWLMNAMYDFPMEELVTYPQKIQAVTLAEINQVAQELIRPQDLVIVSIGA